MLVGVGSEFEMADGMLMNRSTDTELTIQRIANHYSY